MNFFVMMHMADGLISLPIGSLFAIVSVVMIMFVLKRMNQKHDESQIPMMAVMGAFVFACQMINFTIPGTGSSGHIGGAILLCLVVGQYPAFLSMVTVLFIQCLLFGDGGLLALGCNIFNMGFLPCFVAYPLIVKPILSKEVNSKNIILASVVGVVIGLQLGAFAVVLETLASGISELPFRQFVLLMQPIHLAIGLVEGIITALIGLYIYHEKPAIITQALWDQQPDRSFKKLALTFLIGTCLVGGILSLYASEYPDGLEWAILNVSGQEEIVHADPAKDALAAIQEKTTLLPDYGFANSEEALGTSFSGLIGAAVVCLAAGGLGLLVTKRKHG